MSFHAIPQMDGTNENSAGSRTLATPELLTMILAYSIEMPSMLPLQAVSKTWEEVIRSVYRIHYSRMSKATQVVSVNPDIAPTVAIDRDTGVKEERNLVRIGCERDEVLNQLVARLVYCGRPENFFELPSTPGNQHGAPTREEVDQLRRLCLRPYANTSEPQRCCLSYVNESVHVTFRPSSLDTLDTSKETEIWHELVLHPLLTTLLWPIANKLECIRALRAKDTVIVIMPFSSLKWIDQLADAAEASGITPSWPLLPLTNPPVTEVLLQYYYCSKGVRTRWTVVSGVVRKKSGLPFVVLGDLVRRTKILQCVR